jgi:hypothetical protein
MSASELCTRFTDDAGVAGYLVQAWDPATATYTMIDALMTPRRWIEHTPPLVPGKGVPAFAYLTMRLMKLWHARGGSELRREIARDRSAEHADVLTSLGMTLEDVVLFGYETHADLAPYA